MKELHKIIYILQKRAIVPIALAASLVSIFALLSELLPKDIVPIAGGVAASIIGAAIAFSMAEVLRLIRSKKIFLYRIHIPMLKLLTR